MCCFTLLNNPVSAQILCPNPNFSISVVSTDATCNGYCDGTAQVTPSGGNAPYQSIWSDGGVGDTRNGLCAGVYVVVATDADGCQATSQVIISEPPPIVVTVSSITPSCSVTGPQTVCFSITGGTPPYVIQCTGTVIQPGNCISGLVPGTYTCGVIDANGCTQQFTFVVPAGTGLQVTATSTDASCSGTCDGTATATASSGSAPYHYQWSNGGTTSTITNLCPGVYHVTVVDINGCSGTASTIVGQSSPVVVNITTTPATCGANNGSACFQIAGGTPPYTIDCGSVATVGFCLNNLSAGTYNCTITDANGCMGTFTFTILGSSGFTVNHIAQDVSCFGDCDGSATIIINGGQPPFTYLWSNGMVGGQQVGLCAGTYDVSITDVNGCNAVETIVINQPNEVHVNCYISTATGELCASAIGGTPPYIFVWSDGYNTPCRPQPVMQVTVIVIDANNCTSVDTCGSGPYCPTPTGLHTTNVTSTSATLNWNAALNALGYDIRGRPVTSNTWTQITVPANPTFKNVFSLAPNTTYVWQIRTICTSTGIVSPWSVTDTFTTSGLSTPCLPPTNHWAAPVLPTAARLNWATAPNAHKYNIVGKNVNSNNWISIQVPGNTNFKNIFGLTPGNMYHWKIRTVCIDATGATSYSQFTPLDTFVTPLFNRLGQLDDDADESALEYGRELIFFPNPASEKVTIDMADGFEKETDLRIVDATGKTVYQIIIDADQASLDIDVSNLEAGIYFLIGSSEEFKSVSKLVIARR